MASSVPKPTIIFIPGLWEGPSIFSSLARTLSAPPYSYPTHVCSLPSTGTVSPGNPSLQDDVRGLREQIAPFIVEEGREVVLVMHSAGGFLGCNAIKGWGVERRRMDREDGGVRKLVFLAGGIVPEGSRHPESMPFFENDGHGRMHCCSRRSTLFNDLPDSVANHWLSQMQCQPSDGWADVITYAAWKEISSIYLVCEDDKVLPAEMQRRLAAMAGSEVMSVKNGHMVMLSNPEKSLEIILKAAAEE